MISSTCSACRFWHSSIGKKIVVALTGAFLVIFLAGHLVGNMLIFQSSEAFNHYADFLHTMLHGWGIWLFRATMLVSLALHILATVQLTAANRAARPRRYEHDATMVASKSSRIMIWSGLTIIVFFVFHILHYTVRIQDDLKLLADFHQNWAMTVAGFQSIPVVLFYILAMALLCSHLSHGVGSIFQTLGLRTKKSSAAIGLLSKVYAIVIFLGFISIPISICFFGLGKCEMEKTEKVVKQLKEKGHTHLPENLAHKNISELTDADIPAADTH
ncbi:MAG: succinate dehydrogenase cytochrome b subunit [Akkermansiaceae bacterium]|nr:succinate dehydrogenase cytochrome b subunit [Verrucomicrobiae bacterium]MCP5535551.1 succinate dehydrogenase cytochrome b subunit [Akkermansiaceae bacterium]